MRLPRQWVLFRETYRFGASALMRTYLVSALCALTLLWFPAVSLAAQNTSSQSAPLMSIPGNFSVSASGSAAYSIPIIVPPGTKMVPSLSLGYSSQSGDGSVGIGWNLGGLGAIARCPRTIAQDGGVHGSVNYDSNDRFCMGGQRLIVISGTYGANGSEYRTEVESFSRIIAHGSAGSGPAWFEVHTKAGQIMEFGNTADSRALVVSAVSGVTTTARLWAVNKVSDTVGNYYTVTYNCAAVLGACTDASRTTYGELYPLEVDYTGNTAAGVAPYNSVKFTYSGRVDSVPMYQAGAVTQNTILLTHVKTYQASNLVSDYQLAYRAGTATQHSRLTSVTLCDGSSIQMCLNPTTFGWQGGQGYLTMTAAPKPLPPAQGSQLFPGDFNGDGLLDVMPVDAGQCSPYYIYLGVNNLGMDPTPWGTVSTPWDGAISCIVGLFTQAIKNPGGNPYLLAEISATTAGPVTTNNLIMLNSQAGNVEVQSYTPTGTPPTYPGDYNGDGLIDFFSQLNPTSYAYIGTGMGIFNPDGGHSGFDPAHESVAAADFDGDGCTDLLAVGATLGDPDLITYFCSPAAATATPPSLFGYNVTLGDFNGDGKTDILLTKPSTAGKLYLSTGTGFVLSSCAVPSSWGGFTVETGNWDGDGKSDLLLVSPTSPGTSQLWLSTGNCFTQALDSGGNPITIHTVTSTSNPVIADWNNDGASDIWMQGPFNNGSPTQQGDVLYTFNFSPELMTSVSNGVGAATNVSYDRINENGDFYSRGMSASYPTIDIDGAYYVVRRVDLGNGLGTCVPAGSYPNCYSSTYAYAGGQTDLTGRGFLGFSQVVITNLQTKITDTTNYSVVFPYTGTVISESRHYANNTNNLSITTNTYANNSGCSITSPSGVYFVCLTQMITAGVDLNDTGQLPTTTTSYTYDSYGNALTINASVVYGASTSTSNTTDTYNNDTTNWFLGQLLTTSVNNVVGYSNLTQLTSFSYDSVTGLLDEEDIEPGVSTCNGGLSSCTLSTFYTFDSFGNRTSSEVYGAGVATRMTYAGYDSLGKFQIYGMNALGQAETWAHDPRFGDVTSHTGPNGLTTTWSYDTFGRKVTEIRPGGTQTVDSYLYCTGSCPANGAFFALSEILAPGGLAQAGPISTSYFDVLTRAVAKDSQGFDGSDTRIETLFDASGNPYKASRPYFVVGGAEKYTTATFDALGRVTQTLSPNSVLTSYSFNGLTASTTNEFAATTIVTKNAQGLNASVEDALYKTTSYVYDAFGNLTNITDPAGNVVSNSYDIRGNKYQSVDPDMGTWNYTFDVLGQLTRQIDAKSQVTNLTYDLLGRRTIRDETAGLFSTWTYGTSLTNHDIGRLTEAKACSSSSCSTLISDRTFSFDSVGRPTLSILHTSSNFYGYRINYNLLNNQAESISYPSGLTVGYSYNSYGYLCVIAETSGGSDCSSAGGSKVFETVNARDAEGHLTQSTSGNGVVTTQTFDPNNGLPVSTRAGTGGAIASFDYEFDGVGNLLSRTDNNESYTEGFCYDSLNRLVNYSVGAVGVPVWGSPTQWGSTFLWGPSCGTANNPSWGSPRDWGAFKWGPSCTSGSGTCNDITYDLAGIGNISSKSDVGTYIYPLAGSLLPHAVSSISGTVDGLINPNYGYDGNGNMTCVSTGVACTGTIGRQITLTPYNMAATITAGSFSFTFAYDSEHRRIQQATTVSGITTTTAYLDDPISGTSSEEVIVGSGAPVWTDYIKLDGQIVAQRTSTFLVPTFGSPTMLWGTFIWGQPVSASNWGAHNWLAFNWGGASNSTWEYFTLDHLGSIAVIADDSGSVVQRLSFDAWGKQRNPNGTNTSCGAISSSTTRGFTNQEQIPADCLINLNARIYDPTIGKFMAGDPSIPEIFNGQSFNRYAYVNNNPLSYSDPTGYQATSTAWGASTTNSGVVAEGTDPNQLGTSPDGTPDDFVYTPPIDDGKVESVVDTGFLQRTSLEPEPPSSAILSGDIGDSIGSSSSLAPSTSAPAGGNKTPPAAPAAPPEPPQSKPNNSGKAQAGKGTQNSQPNTIHVCPVATLQGSFGIDAAGKASVGVVEGGGELDAGTFRGTINLLDLGASSVTVTQGGELSGDISAGPVQVGGTISTGRTGAVGLNPPKQSTLAQQSFTTTTSGFSGFEFQEAVMFGFDIKIGIDTTTVPCS